MAEIRYYVAASGAEPFAEWFVALDAVARAKVTRAIARMEQGNFSNAKAVGERVLEYRIDFGAAVSNLLRARWRHAGDPPHRRHEEAPAARHRHGACVLARLQAEQTRAALK